MMNGLIYRAGMLVRNSAITDRYKFLFQSQRWTRQQLEDHQYQHLGALLRHAYEKSEYYHTKFDRAGFNPRDFSSLSQLQTLPITTKKDLIEHTAEIQIR